MHSLFDRLTEMASGECLGTEEPFHLRHSPFPISKKSLFFWSRIPGSLQHNHLPFIFGFRSSFGILIFHISLVRNQLFRKIAGSKICSVPNNIRDGATLLPYCSIFHQLKRGSLFLNFSALFVESSSAIQISKNNQAEFFDRSHLSQIKNEPLWSRKSLFRQEYTGDGTFSLGSILFRSLKRAFSWSRMSGSL